MSKNGTYSVTELGRLYFPDCTTSTATKQVRRWIKRNTVLEKALLDAGYYSGQKYFTPRQVELIFEIIGRP